MPIVLPPGGIPDCESQAVAATTTTSAVNGPAPEKRRAVVVRDGGLPTVRHQVVDRQGRPVNLRDCTGVAAGGSVGSEGLEAGTDPVLVLRIREAISGVVTSFPAAVVTNGSDGWVQAAAVNLAALGGPGIFDAEFGLVVTGGTVLVVGAPSHSSSRRACSATPRCRVRRRSPSSASISATRRRRSTRSSTR